MRRISSNSEFEKAVGYSRAVVDDDYVHVSGTTGFDYETMTIADDVVEQGHQVFRNIARTLAAARCSFSDLVRVTFYVSSGEDYELLMPVFKQYLGPNPPAATALIVQLVDPRMKIEIEATARRPNAKSLGGQD
ncbi:MAG: RidA family protein [Alphaproteobacteria bacterium]|jgi:enamine deaminase RidA (YjgF/YER057c/UK114 family)|nr:RidA family protein [Alphaproteobacteria bacterium]